MLAKPKAQMRKLIDIQELYRGLDGSLSIDANGPMTTARIIAQTLAISRASGIDAIIAFDLAKRLYDEDQGSFLLTEEELNIIRKAAENQPVELPVGQKALILNTIKATLTVEVSETKNGKEKDV